MKNPDVVIYHANCHDGFCCAWLIHRYCEKNQDRKYLPYHYDGKIPSLDEIRDKNVIIADFSFKRDDMEAMRRVAKSLLVYDHHKTAEEELRGFSGAVFDMDRSGSQILFDEYLEAPCVGRPSFCRPWIVEYVGDRDLWRWKLPDSKIRTEYLRSFPMEFDVWDRLADMVDEKGMPIEWNRINWEGGAIERIKRQIVSDSVKNARRYWIGDYPIPILGLNLTLYQSETLNQLAQGEPFAFAFFIKNMEDIVISLRSDEKGIDVGEFAKRHGGGGHAKAAGVTVCVKSEFIRLAE